MPLTLKQFREKHPAYNDLSDRDIIDKLHTKFYSDIPKQNFERRFVVGDKAIAKDVPPPDESIGAQFKRFTESPEPFEVKAGRAIEKSFRTNEVIAEMAARAAIHPFTKAGRQGESLRFSQETIDAFQNQPDITSAKDAALNIAGTQGRFRKLAEEKISKTRGGPLNILPETIFGVPTAEIPREALKELTDFAGFMVNPKQPLVISPVLQTAFGLSKLALIKALRFVAKKIKGKPIRTIDAFKLLETEVVKRGGKPQPKLLSGKERKLLPDIKSEVGVLDIEPIKKAPVFFSKLQKTIRDKMPVKAGVEMVRNLATKGATKEEVKWSGINEFLADKKTVTKEEVMNFLQANEVKIEETVLGGKVDPSLQQELEDIRQKRDMLETDDEFIEARIIREGLEKDRQFGIREGTSQARKGIEERKLKLQKRLNEIESSVKFKEANEQMNKLISRQNDILKEQSRQEVFQHTKYHNYQLPGGKNYKELLLRMPDSADRVALILRRTELRKKIDKLESEIDSLDITSEGKTNPVIMEKLKEHRNLEIERNKIVKKLSTMHFQSPHFDEPNILSHPRTNERISDKGEKVLFIEEIQSDWAREGRKRGFVDIKKLNQLRVREREIIKKAKPFTDKGEDAPIKLIEESVSIADAIAKLEAGVSNAPLLKTWHEFTLKRLLREAVDKGFDRLAWISGKATADRYDISLLTNKIEYALNKDGSYALKVFPKSQPDKFKSLQFENRTELERTVGKEIADRIINNQGESTPSSLGGDVKFAGILKGKDLAVGGQWAFNLYDRMIPQFLNKFGKKFGAKVENVGIKTVDKGVNYRIVRSHGEPVLYTEVIGDLQRAKEIAIEAFEQTQFKHKVVPIEPERFQSIPITDAMKKVALEEGFELFAGVNPFKLLPKKAQTRLMEFFIPFSTLPKSEQLLFARSQQMGKIAQAERIIARTKKRIDSFPLEDRKQMYRFLDGQISSFDLPADIRLLAKSIQQRQIQIGRALVNRGVLNKEAFEALKGKYVHYIYARHIIGADVDIDPSRILSPTGKLNLTYLMSRNPNLTHNDRLALGLIEDAGIAVPVGMGKALTDLAKFDYLEKSANNPEVVWQPSVVTVGNQKWGISKLVSEVNAQAKVAASQPQNAQAQERFRLLNNALEQAKKETGSVPSDFRQLPNIKTFGNLAGAYIRKPIFDDIMPLASSFSSSSTTGKAMQVALRLEQQSVGLFKLGKVPYNPPTVFRNLISNIIQNNMRGRPLAFIPGDIIKAVNGIRSKEPLFIQARRDGLFQTNFSVTELNEIFGVLNEINASRWSSFLSKLHKLGKYYGKIDDIAKYAIYRQLRKGGIIDFSFKPPMDHAEAMLEAQKWGMDYSLASRSIKEARRHILPLFTYQYKIAPLILESLKKRPWVIGKYMALLGIAGYGIASEVAKEMQDMSNEDWKKMLRKMPDYIRRNTSFAILPYKSPEGNWQWVNLEYYFPWGNWMSLLRDFKEQDFTQMLKSAGVSNPILEVLVAFKGTPFGKIPKDPFTGKNIYDQLDSPAQQWMKIAEFLYQRWGPSFLSRYGAAGFTAETIQNEIRKKKGLPPLKDKWGKTITPSQAIGRWFGFNVITVTPRQSAVIKQAKMNELRQELNRKLNKPNISREKKREIIKRFNKKAKEIQLGTD